MPIDGYVDESSPAAARADGPTSAVADCRAVAQPDLVQRLLGRFAVSIAEVDAAVAQATAGR
ncbi:hypothetical protein ACFXMT_05345 [Streptomyces mirabilis]|uniref:hypothetical protein n=1 Tax=Streptomyces mirabilis TaxID=68239 RepID=UPI00366940A8